MFEEEDQDIEEDFEEQFQNLYSIGKQEQQFMSQPFSAKDQDFNTFLATTKSVYPEKQIGINLDKQSFPAKQLIKVDFNSDIKVLNGKKKIGILNSTLVSQSQAFIERLKFFYDELGQQDETFYVSRLLFDGNKYSKDHPLYATLNDQTKKIDFKEINDYLIYPDEWETQEKISVKQVKQQKLESLNDSSKNRQPLTKDLLSIVVAAGPYTQDDSLGYRPLLKLVQNIQKKKVSCDILILLGPIVDENNLLIKSQNIDPDEQFFDVLNYISKALNQIKILIVNSLKEFSCIYPIPQPEMYQEVTSVLTEKENNEYSEIPSNIQLLGNPAKISILDDLLIGIINVDVLTELKKNSKFFGQSQLKTSRILEEFLHQQSFIPIIPASFPIELTSINEQLDLKWSEEGNKTDLPHIFISPSSSLAHVEKINNTIFINPSHLSEEAKFAHILFNISVPDISDTRVEILNL